MGTFTRYGTIQQEFCGQNVAKWVLREHNTHTFLKAFDSFEDCVNHVYPYPIEYHRQPTEAEVKFGEGATHYRSFDPINVVDTYGKLKQWFVSKDDSLRYYY